MDLSGYLNRSPAIPNGRAIAAYSPTDFPFEAAAKSYLERKFPGLNCGDLSRLHMRLPPRSQNRAGCRINEASCLISEETPELLRLYHRLLRRLAKDFFREDLVFERRPNLRFHFPVPAPGRYRRKDGRLASYHSDALLGDYFEEVNCWLPITRCYGSNSLQIAELPRSVELLQEFAFARGLDLAEFHRSRERFFRALEDDAFHDKVSRACRPLSIGPGEMIAFDSRCLHATAENVESATRVSVDFRALTVSAYEAATRARREQGLTFEEMKEDAPFRGVFYHHATILELDLG